MSTDNINEAEVDKKEEETPVKPTRAQKFFNILDKFGDLFFLNIYFVFTSIPIITIGASFTALYSVAYKMTQDKEGTVKEDYFKAFRDNFKQSTTIWIVDLIYIIIMYLQYAFVISDDSKTSRIIFILLGFEFVLAAFAIPLQFPLVARYENGTLNQIVNALVFAVANLGTWFRMFFIWTFLFLLYYLNPKIMVYTWFLWLLIFVSLFAYVCSMFLMKLFEKLEAPKTE